MKISMSELTGGGDWTSYEIFILLIPRDETL